MTSYPIPKGAVVLLMPGRVEEGRVMRAVPMDPQPQSIAADETGAFPFISLNGEERQFRPPLVQSDDQRRLAEIDAELLALDAKLERRGEDLWLALKSLGATVTPYVQSILDRKRELREERSGLE
jgi:hypothetical protein